jgi:cytochrome c-type biogenesis protein CcmF
MWAWDPVENAGLLPWLVGTALLHSAMMQRRRGILKRWNMVLVILTFLLSIFGTFLTRSGIIASVHTFSDSALGMLFLVFMGISAVGSFILLYMRNEDLKSETQIESIVSRESTFLLNNLFLVCGTAAVLLGTIFPILSEAVRGVKITVGPPFYNQVMAPLFLGIIFLTGVCTMIGWRRASKKNLLRNFLLPLVATAILAVVLFATVIKEWYAVLAFSLCGFVIFTIIYEWFRGTRARARMRSENFLKAFWGLFMANRPRYGGYIVHIGIVLLAVGVIGSSVYDESKEVTLQRGDTVTLDGYTLTLKGSDTIETASKVTFTTTLSVKEGDRSIGLVTPEKYIHRNHNTPVTVAAVRSTLLEDLYVILIGSESDGSASFKIMSSPLVIWVWIGGAIHVLGGLIAFWPGGRKQELLADVAEV